MKLIKACVCKSQIDPVVHSLKSVGVQALSLISVQGVGNLADPVETNQLSPDSQD